ncbi:MAG: C4-type zinc ribbon domain-containing protein [Deltaproteobacteria bacterium]
MNDNSIETLAALQAIDQRRRERLLEIEDLQASTAETLADLELKRAEVGAARESASLASIRRRELEALLQEEERRVMDKRMRLDRIRNERELEAAQGEIETLRESKSRHEDELLGMMEQDETVEGGLEEAEGALKELDAGAQKQQASANSRTAQLNKEITAEAAERERIAALLPDSLRRRYERIFTRREGLAVVRARNGNCTGCKMRIPPQLYNEILRCDAVHSCPDCQRILFWQEETEADREEA